MRSLSNKKYRVYAACGVSQTPNDSKNRKGAFTSLFHEMGHEIDRLYNNPSHSIAFEKALQNDFKRLQMIIKSIII